MPRPSLVTFVFGPSRRWEYLLVMVRLAVMALAIAGIGLLLSSPWKRYAGVVFLSLLIAVLASVVYQYRRRWRELSPSGSDSE